MNGFIIIGFLCLGLLVLFYMFFMKRQWFNFAFRVILIGSAIYAIYLGVLVTEKYIREERTTYASVEEIIEKNYSGSNVNMISSGNYYYLIIKETEGSTESKEELIRYENNKYTACDTISRYTKGIKQYDCWVYSAPLGSSRRIEYEFDDLFVVIIKRDSNFRFINIYDDYSRWDFILANNYYYYIKVINKEELSDKYRVFANSESNVYELAKSSLYDGYDWLAVEN